MLAKCTPVIHINEISNHYSRLINFFQIKQEQGKQRMDYSLKFGNNLTCEL